MIKIYLMYYKINDIYIDDLIYMMIYIVQAIFGAFLER